MQILKESFCFFCIYLLFSSNLLCQNSDAPKNISTTYYIKNCFVFKDPGTLLSGQNIIIKDGLISEIGQNIKPPFDAQIIPADSMYVYAGFIDAYSHTGIPKSENKDRPKVADPGNPPNDVAGITPQVTAADLYKPYDKSVADMRSSGFVISQVSPRGLMLPGQSCLFLLGEGNSDKMLLKKSTSQNFKLESNWGIYPSTSIAIMSKFRDLYKNAQISRLEEEKYRKNSVGTSRPKYSKEVSALYALTNNETPLYFLAPLTKDVNKALSLRKELGFNLVLAEVKQGWHYADQIKKHHIPILLSLDLPEEEKKEIKKNLDTSEKKDSLAKENTKVEIVNKNPDEESYDKRKAAALKEYLNQAALFEKQGIPFGFSYQNVKPGDIRKNIKKLIDNGLSEKYALAALTTHPAEILGISGIAGTVEKGKMANIVLTDKPYFEDKSAIKYVFVDGQIYKYSENPKKAENKTNGLKTMTGNWTFETNLPDRLKKGILKCEQQGDAYNITLMDDLFPSKELVATAIKREGNEIRFTISTETEPIYVLSFNLKFEDNSFTGLISRGQKGTFAVSGNRMNRSK